MQKRMLARAAAICLLLSGCSLYEGSFVHVTHREGQVSENQEDSPLVGTYQELQLALGAIVDSGKESGILYVTDLLQASLEKSMTAAILYTKQSNPVGSYAVEDITYQVGTNSGRTAVAVSVQYTRTAAEIQKILRLDAPFQVEGAVMQALENFDDRLVMQVGHYMDMDIPQMVQNLAQENPDKVMETPSVVEVVYGNAQTRIIEVTFSYENTRESLRMMCKQVQPVFDSAELYVSGEDDTNRKLSQLYGFLMERFDYKQDTSLTPTYSLLRHGVGDSRAFANVYSAMCRRSGLTCLTVTGTRNAEPWTWNIVLDGDVYYHVDLLACAAMGGFREMTDDQMYGYVWDYSAYPECGFSEESSATETPIPESSKSEN